MPNKFSLIVVGLLIAVGCNQPESQMSTVDSAQLGTFDSSNIKYEPAVVDLAPANQMSWSPPPTQAAPPATGIDSTYQGDESAGLRIHVVKPKDTLYGLARLYYYDASHWKRIYEANRHIISDPNKIKVGMRLIIP